MKSNRSAFTLIELLVVIAIIAILAAILLPVFSSAKEASKQTVCIAHMKQLGYAIMMYRDEHDDTYNPAELGDHYWDKRPWIGYDTSVGANQPAQGPEREGLLDRFIKEPKLKSCPAKPNRVQLPYALNGWVKNVSARYYFDNPLAKEKEYGPFTKDRLYSGAFNIGYIGAKDSEIELSWHVAWVWHHDHSFNHCAVPQLNGLTYKMPQLDKAHFYTYHRKGRVFLVLWGDGRVKGIAYESLRRSNFTCRVSGLGYPDFN